MPSDMQRDEQGRPFFNVQGTNRRSYVSPVAMGTGSRPEGDGFLRQRFQWNQDEGAWEQPIDPTAIGLMGVGSLAGAAVLPALLGGGGAASMSAAQAAGNASVLPSATMFPTAGMLPAGGAGLGSGGSMAMATAAAPAAAAGGSGVAATGGMSFGRLAGLGALGTGFDLLGSLLGGGEGTERRSFAGRRAANGQDIDPGNVYGEGMAGMRQLMPVLQNRVSNPKPRLRDVYAQPVAGLSGVDPGYQRRQAGGAGSGMTPEQLAIIRQVLGI